MKGYERPAVRVSSDARDGSDGRAVPLVGLHFPGKGSAGSAGSAFFETEGVRATGSFVRCAFQRHPGAVTRENGNLPSLLTLLSLMAYFRHFRGSASTFAVPGADPADPGAPSTNYLPGLTVNAPSARARLQRLHMTLASARSRTPRAP